MRAADALREAAEQGLQTFSLPVEGVMKGDQAALELTDEARVHVELLGKRPGPELEVAPATLTRFRSP